MKQLCTFLSMSVCVVLLALLLTSCGHNNALHSKGWGIDVSWSQDSFIPNLRLGYWDVSYVMVKENVEVEMTSTAGLNANAGNTSGTETNKNIKTEAGGNAGNTIKLKTGPQINGYTKDVLTAPKLSKQSVEIVEAMYNVKKNSKKTSTSTNSSTSKSTASESTAKISSSK